MSGGVRRATGCGLGVVLAIIMVISLIGWLLSFLDISGPARQLQPVPDNVPPAAGAAVLAGLVDTALAGSLGCAERPLDEPGFT